jgi:hypothetical protein
MKIAIRDTEKVPFWSLPDTNIQLNYLNPGPIEFDPSGLTPQQRQILWVALAKQVLACEGAKELIDLIRPQVKVIPLDAKPKESAPVSLQSDVNLRILEGKVESKTQELKKVLKLRIPMLRKELPLKTTSELKTLLDIEETWKNRKAITTLIRQLLEAKQKEVLSSIERKSTASVITEEQMHQLEIGKGIRHDLLQNISDVVESENETIEIALGAKID